MKLMQCMADIPSQARRLFTVILSFVACLAYSQTTVTFDGLNYSLDSDNKTAKVIQTNPVPDQVEIPSTIIVDDIKYTVTELENTFVKCENLISVTIPSTVTKIGNEAFYGCTSLNSIEIPNSVVSIGDEAFSFCTALESVKIPCSVVSIAQHAFYCCSALSSIIIDANNTVYDSRDNCNAIIVTSTNSLLIGSNNATIPEGVTSIGSDSFYKCEKLTSINIPNTVTSIGGRAFCHCTSLKSIYIPSSVISIGSNAFGGTNSVTSIIVDENNSFYDSRENCNCIIYTKSNTLIRGCDNSFIPNSVTKISDYAFDNCKYLNNISIPNHITSLEVYTFRECKNLSSITLPNELTTLGASCFYNCTNLTSINIPSKVTTIGAVCFGFCRNLTSVTCSAPTPPTIYAKSFYYVDKSIPVYVPAASIEAYKATQYWSEFTNFQAIAEPTKTEWRISDRTDIEVDFHSIDEAMGDERVQDGHTLFIERGSHLTDATITKKVTIVGPGYDLANDSRNAKVDFLIINAENVKVVGLQIQNALVCNNNVNIENCYITNSVLGNETSYENDNCVIKSCFIDGNVYGRGEDGTYEWTLTNNIIKGGVYNFEEMTLNHNTIVSANYVLNGVNFSTVTNNLLHQTKSDSPIVNCSDNEYDKNVVSLASNTYGEKSNQTLEKSISCSGDANSEDYYTPVGYTLGYSTDGTDCGAFGGSNPYVKGGKSGLFVEREGEEEPEPEPEPTYPETPIVKGQLDNTATLDIENDVYNSLGEFLKALSIRGIKAGTDIAVANQQFDIALDDESYGYIQTSAVALEMAKAYIYMKASNNATFNITLSPAFAAAHASDVQTVVATIMGFANHIITTNIKILINGTLYQYTGFQVEPNDLLDLKNLYTALNGENWTNVKWSFLSNGRLASDFPGVTFTEPNELGQSYVKELDLVKNNMKGDVSNLTLYFPQLTSLNMYYNQLTGDMTNMVSNLGNLKTLDISYNMLTGLTGLPSSVATLNKGNQFRSDYNQEYLSKLSAATVYISDKQSVGLPTIMTYDLKTNSNVPTAMYISERSTSSLSAYYGQLVPHGGGSTSYYTSWTSKPFTYEYAQDHEIYLRSDDDTIYPAILKYEAGDANMSGYTDLLDVQTTISKVLSPSVVSLFNKTAANTYNDEIINVQDVVCTVNIVLGKPIVSIEIPTETGNHYDQPLLASRRATPVSGGKGNILFVEGERLWLTNETEVGAIEVELRGLQADEVSLALNRKDFQMASLDIKGGSRHIIYSLSGKSVPVGTAAILRLSSDYTEVADAALSTVDAKSLSFTIGVTPTAIKTVDSGDMLKARFEGNNIVISSSREISNAEVVVTSASGINTLTWKGECIKAGETMIEADLASGIYIIGIYENGKRIGNAKLIKK